MQIMVKIDMNCKTLDIRKYLMAFQIFNVQIRFILNAKRLFDNQ